MPAFSHISIPRLLRCGELTRLTYEVTTGPHKQRTSLTVARASLVPRQR